MKNEIECSYPVSCIGSAPAGVELDPGLTAVDASVAVYADGNRQVGCAFVDLGLCTKFGESRKDKSRCVHLYPEKSSTTKI